MANKKTAKMLALEELFNKNVKENKKTTRTLDRENERPTKIKPKVNNTTDTKKSSESSVRGSKGYSREEKAFRENAKKSTAMTSTAPTRTLDRDTTKTKTRTLDNEWERSHDKTYGGTKRARDTIRGAGEQWLGGHISSAGTTLQSAMVDAESLHRAKAEEDNPYYGLRSREEAGKRTDAYMRDLNRKEGIDLANVERAYDLNKYGGQYSEEYRKLWRLQHDAIRKGDSLIESGGQRIEDAKKGAGKLGSLAIDLGANALQMGGDMALNFIVPSLGMASLMNRAGGTASYEARQLGFNPDQQFLYQQGTALVEGMSEQLFNSVSAFQSAYGRGAFELADKVGLKTASSQIVRNFFKTEAGRSIAIQLSRLGADAFEEGFEEIVAGVAEPALKYMLMKANDPTVTLGGQYDLKEIGYDFLVGALMGGMGGSIDAYHGVKSDLDLANSQAYADGQEYAQKFIDRALVQGREGGTKTDAEILAEQLQTQKSGGKEILPYQTRMLQEKIAESSARNEELFSGKVDTEIKRANSEGRLATTTGTRAEAKNFVSSANTLEARNVERAQRVLGEDATEEGAYAVGSVTTGTATTEDIDMILTEPKLKKAVETITGIDLPSNNAKARTALEDITAMNRIANRNTAVKTAQERQAKNIKASLDNMSEGGQTLFEKNTERAKETVGSLPIYKDIFTRIYLDGTTKGATAEQTYERAIESLGDSKVKELFTRDFVTQIFNEGRATVVADQAKQTAKSNADKYANRTSGVSFENNDTTLVSGRVAKALEKIAKGSKAEIRVVKSLEAVDENGKPMLDSNGRKLTANGMYKDGIIYISAESKNKLITVAKHELTHYIKDVSPERYQELEDFVFERWYNNDAETMQDAIMKYQRLYNGITPEEAREEIIADSSEAFFTDQSAIEDAIAFSRKLGTTIHRGIKSVLTSFSNALKGDSRNERGYGQFLKEMDILQDAERMWFEALNESARPRKKGKTQTTESKAKNSLTAEDSDGNKLSEGQVNFFENSQVRDRDGKLLKVYHGTDEDFYEFSRNQIGRHGSYEGAGFNFTPSEARATGYAFANREGKVLGGYLNITHPLSSDKVTFTANQLAKVIRDIDPTGDDIIANYARDTNDYGKPSFIMRESLYTARQMLNYHDSDADIYADLSASGANSNAIISAFEAMGYDGVIHYNPIIGNGKFGGDIKTLIAFRSNQFKDADNLNPTESNDRRYSLSTTEEQEFTSADTSINSSKVPAVFNKVNWKSGTVNVDIGGGRFDTAQEFLKPKGVTNLVYDPYNRSAKHNQMVSDRLDKKKADTATISNVLNVIQEKGARLEVLYNAKENVKAGGEVYITVYEGNGSGVGAQTTKGYQLNMKLADYLAEVKEVFPDAYIRKGMIIAPNTEKFRADLNENGNVIPLSERFNDSNDDIRFSLSEDDTKNLKKENAKLKSELWKSNERTAVERWRGEVDLQKLQQHHREVEQAKRERREESEDRTKLLNIARRLSKVKTNEPTRQLINEFIGELDLVAKSMTGKTLKKLGDLSTWYDEQVQADPYFYDSNIEKKLDRVTKKQIAEINIEDVRELTTILKGIETSIRNGNKFVESKYKKTMREAGIEAIKDIDQSVGLKNKVIKKFDRFFINGTLSPLRQMHRVTGYNDNDPLYIATQELADGQRNMLSYEMNSWKMFQKYMDDKKFVNSLNGKKAREIILLGQIEGKSTAIKVTPDVAISLYLSSMNEDNLRHMGKGGVEIPDFEMYKKGDLKEAYNASTLVTFSKGQLDMIKSRLTEKEKAFASTAYEYYNEVAPNAINRVSNILKGYDIARVNNYFPIQVNKDFLDRDFESLKFDGTIEGMGSLKERVVSNTPVVVNGIVDTLTRSIKENSMYVGLAIPVRNFGKLLGIKQMEYHTTEKGKAELGVEYTETTTIFKGSVQKSIRQKWGDPTMKYIEKFMGDLQMSRPKTDDWENALNSWRSNYAGAVLTLNLSVAIKQTASYPTAIAVLGTMPTLRALGKVGKVDLNLIEKYSPLQWHRSRGYSVKELGDIKSGKKGSFVDKVTSLPFFNWIQTMDVLTTRKLWKASEYYVRQHNKNLTKGTDEYYKAVAKIYDRVIEETQPNYTIMQRPQLLRSDSSVVQTLNMFKTQPFQNFNILYDAIGNYIAKAEAYKADKSAENKAKVRQANTDMNNALWSQFLQLATFASMTFVWAFLRGKDDKWKDEEQDKVTLESFLKRLGIEMLSGSSAMLPLGADIYSLATHNTTGDYYSGFQSITDSAINDLFNTGTDLVTLIGDALEYKNAEDKENIDTDAIKRQMEKVVKEWGRFAGVPAQNVKNLFDATYRWVMISANGKYVGEYEALKETFAKDTAKKALLLKSYNFDKEQYKELRQRMIEDGFEEEKLDEYMWGKVKPSLLEAYNSDKAKYQELRQEMIDNGFSQEKIDNYMWDNRKEALFDAYRNDQQKYEELRNELLSEGYAEDKLDNFIDSQKKENKTEAEQSAYDESINTLESSSLWAEASDEDKDKYSKILEKMSVGIDDSQTESIKKKAIDGLTEEQVVLYKLALKKADQPNANGNLGTYTKAEKEEALRLLAEQFDLTEEQKAVLKG